MNPFEKTIVYEKSKENHFYAIKLGAEYLKVDNPKKGDNVYEIPTISGGSENNTKSPKKSILLQIPIPLCEKHQHNGKPFGVQTCNNWNYIAIPTLLGSLSCRECLNKLYLPEPFLNNIDLYNADLSGADLSGADLRDADLRDADLSDADLSGADLRDADLRDADLRDADLRDADLRDADFRGAKYNSLTLKNINELWKKQLIQLGVNID